VPEPESSEPLIYLHNPEEGIELPPNPQGIFAVVRIKGLQYKVTKDDRVMVEKLEIDVGQ